MRRRFVWEWSCLPVALSGLQPLQRKAIIPIRCAPVMYMDTETSFDDVTCNYCYLESDSGKSRRPSDSDCNFEPGEFAMRLRLGILDEA